MPAAMFGAIAAQQSSFAQTVAAGILSGATVVPDLKAFDQHIGDTRTAELNPTMRVVAQMQGTSSEFLAVSHYEGCAGVIDGANYSVQTPLMTSVLYDDNGRPVAGAAQQGQDLYAKQTTPGNALITGTKNTGKVPFLSGLFAGDGAAVDPYGTFGFTDPITGKTYSAKSKPDSVQQQPRVRATISDGLLFGPSTGLPNVGKPIQVNLAPLMGLQFVDDGNGGKAVATLADLTSIGYDGAGALTSLLGKGGNGSENLKAGDAIWFLPGPPPTSAPVLTPHAGSGLALTTSYDYAYAVMTARGDTALSPIASITTDATNRNVQIDIAALPAGTIGSGIRVVRRVSGQAASGTNPASAPSAWKTVQAITASLASPFSLVDSTPSTALGAAYTESPTTINVKLYAQQTAPYGTSVAIPGSTPPLFPLNGLAIGDTTSGGGNNNGLGVNAKYGNTIDAENYLDTLFAATAAIRSGWGKQLQTMKGYSVQKYNASGYKFGGDSGFGARLNLAAYQTPSITGILAPIITDTVTGLQDAEGTKKLVSGLRVDGGDDQSGVMIDVAVDRNGHPLGLKIGQGVDGNGLAAFPDMSSIDYRSTDGALEAKGLTVPPSTTTPPTPPVTTTNPPGTTCDSGTYDPITGATNTTCTTVTSVPGTPTYNSGTGVSAGGGPTGTTASSPTQPGFDCSGGTPTTTSFTLTPADYDTTVTSTSYSRSIAATRNWIDVPFSGSFAWVQGRFDGTAMATGSFVDLHFTTNLAPSTHYGLRFTKGSGWSLLAADVHTGLMTISQNPGDPCYFALVAEPCTNRVRCFLGNEPNTYTEVGVQSFTAAGYVLLQFSLAGNIGTWPPNPEPGIFPPPVLFDQADSIQMWTAIPSDVKIFSVDENPATVIQGTTYSAPTLPSTSTASSTTTSQPPAKVDGNLNILGNLASVGQSLNGFVAAGLLTAVDVNSPFALVGDSFAQITDPFTGVGYTLPISMIPNGAPGAMSGGYFWPGA
jgi:hypothetical protein